MSHCSRVVGSNSGNSNLGSAGIQTSLSGNTENSDSTITILPGISGELIDWTGRNMQRWKKYFSFCKLGIKDKYFLSLFTSFDKVLALNKV